MGAAVAPLLRAVGDGGRREVVRAEGLGGYAVRLLGNVIACEKQSVSQIAIRVHHTTFALLHL